MDIVVGRDSFIGGALIKTLGCRGTSRRPMGKPYFDLLTPDFEFLTPFDTIYLCAAHNGAKACEGNQDAWRANVDAPIEIARACRRSFVVWISSLSIEWMEGAYQRQKRAAESVLRLLPNVGIVRAGRVVNANVDDLCKTLIEVGQSSKAGLTRWGSDDIGYQK